jgi:DNA segregation ATPase FtsK/SpoIIIE, S-DNA-T family
MFRSTHRRRRPPRTYSIYDPIPLGIDEDGNPVNVTLMYRNLLVGGEPGSGKLSLLNTIIAHCPVCPDARLVLIDGKVVEFGLWREAAQVQVRAHFRGCPVTHPAPRRRPGRRRAA